MRILVTGGCGFIGSHLIKKLLKNKKNIVLNIDIIAKHSSKESLKDIAYNKKYKFKKCDINNYKNLKKIIFEFKPRIIFHLAAESHVDRSIESSFSFIKTNILGTFNLLEISRIYIAKHKKLKFKFIHISTDEVYGELKQKEKKFIENSPYFPNSPYSASKASSDHLVRAWNKTYKLPTIITNCSNNYGPWQFPEKLIPLVIYKLINKKKLPIYGNGKNIRDWIFVDDHIRALILISQKGKIGQKYNIGSNYEISNINLVKRICKIFDTICPNNQPHSRLITFVKDRKGHDFRYAINSNKLNKKLKFKSTYEFEKNLNLTINWYLNHYNWLHNKISK